MICWRSLVTVCRATAEYAGGAYINRAANTSVAPHRRFHGTYLTYSTTCCDVRPRGCTRDKPNNLLSATIGSDMQRYNMFCCNLLEPTAIRFCNTSTHIIISMLGLQILAWLLTAAPTAHTSPVLSVSVRETNLLSACCCISVNAIN